MASAAPVGTKGLVAPTEPLSSKRSANISASHLNSSLSDEALITDEEEEETDFGLNMHRILPNLWVGDYPASQKFDCLGQLGIKHIIAAMAESVDHAVRGSYKCPEGFQLHHVDVEDTERTNMLAHFEECNHIISEALSKREGVLIHCHAGVSRSATLCAAYLMSHYQTTSEDAINMIAAVRSQVDPIDFFVLQLEMYERMNYVVDPVTSAEYRRFLYNFNHSEIMDSGDVDRLYLAYFPSPAITPRQARSRRSSSVSSISSALGMTSISRRGSTSSQKGKPDFSMSSSSTDLREESNANKPTSSTRNKAGSHFAMTARTSSYQEGSHVRGMLNQHSEEQPNQSEIKEVQQTPQSSAPRDSSEFLDNKRRHEAKEMMNSKEKLMKIGQGRTLPLQGKRLRCKMCRRELAAREHIVEHQPGEGQEAFAPRRRDMAQFRQDQAKKSSGDMRQPAAATVNPSLSKNARDNPNHPLNQLAKRKAQLESRQEVATTLKSPGPGSSDDDASSPPVSEEESSAVIERPPSPPLLSSSLCTSYFVEPLSWMGSVLQTGAIGGRLTCPAQKCGAKLGSFDWAGQQCSCGAWVVPAFSLNASKVDEL